MRKGVEETNRFICIAIVTVLCLVLTNMKMKPFLYIFLCQRFVVSHTTDFQRPVFGDTKHFITEVQGF